MPNIKSQIKRVKTSQAQNRVNVAARSALKTAVKNFEVAVENNNVESAKVSLQKAICTLDKAVSKGIIHKNKASRKKSRLTKRLGKLIQVS